MRRSKVNIGQKVAQMKMDLAKIVTVCNEAGDYGLAQAAQSCLQSAGSFSEQLGQEEGKTAKIEFK